jgi:hypothetical protein
MWRLLLRLPEQIIPYPEDQNRLYQSLGHALVQWQYIETALFLIAFPLMGTDPVACSLAFFHIKSAENKLSFVDKLIFHKLPQKTRTKYWSPILTDLSKTIEFRNALAHFETSIFKEKEIKKLKKPISKYMWILTRHHLDFHANRSGSMKGLTIENIEGNTNKMKMVAFMLIYFSIDHVPLTEPLLKSLPPKLQQWLDSFRKMPRPPGFEPPRKSSHW